MACSNKRQEQEQESTAARAINTGDGSCKSKLIFKAQAASSYANRR
jgi:hypothetical protein